MDGGGKQGVINKFSEVPYFRHHEAQYQKLNGSCSFFIHKAHRMIRRIKWIKTKISQTVFISFPITPECPSRHWEFIPSLHYCTMEFNLSHMPNPLDSIKIKVVRVFDSVCTNVAGAPGVIWSVVCASSGWSKTASMKGHITVWGKISGPQREELNCNWKTRLLF